MTLDQEREAALRAIDNHGQMLVDHQQRLESLEGVFRHLPELMAQAIKQGARDVVSDPAFWAAAGAAMHQQATERAGTFLLGGLAAFFRRVGWIILIGLGVYMLGGWSALVSWVKSGGPP